MPNSQPSANPFLCGYEAYRVHATKMTDAHWAECVEVIQDAKSKGFGGRWRDGWLAAEAESTDHENPVTFRDIHPDAVKLWPIDIRD